MKTSSAKNKGRELQKHVAQEIVSCSSILQPGDIISRPMGSSGVDLIMSPLAQKLFPYSLECKNTKIFPSIAALRQSEANKYSNTLAGVVWKPPRKGFSASIVYFNLLNFIMAEFGE